MANENPNEYNDDLYARSSTRLFDTINSMWEAGAQLEDIAGAIESALENEGVEVSVSIYVL